MISPSQSVCLYTTTRKEKRTRYQSPGEVVAGILMCDSFITKCNHFIIVSCRSAEALSYDKLTKTVPPSASLEPWRDDLQQIIATLHASPQVFPPHARNCSCRLKKCSLIHYRFIKWRFISCISHAASTIGWSGNDDRKEFRKMW
jgi:hypothetical protein